MGLSMKLFFMRITNSFNSPTKEASEKDSELGTQKSDRSACPFSTPGNETRGFTRGPLRAIGSFRRSDESGIIVKIGKQAALFNGLRGRGTGESFEGQD